MLQTSVLRTQVISFICSSRCLKPHGMFYLTQNEQHACKYNEHKGVAVQLLLVKTVIDSNYYCYYSFMTLLLLLSYEINAAT